MRQFLLRSAVVLAISVLSSPVMAGTSLAIDTAKPSQTVAAGPYLVSNPSGAAALNCDVPMSCDNFALKVTLPTPVKAGQKVQIDLVPDASTDDLDLRLLDQSGAQIATSGNGAGEAEQIVFLASPGVTSYTVQVVPFTVANTTAKLTAKLVTTDSTTPAADPCTQTGSATANAVVAPGVLKSLQQLASSAVYGAFVHFSMGTEAEHTALFKKLGLTGVKSFYPYANSIYVRGPVGGFQKLLDDHSVSYLEENQKLHYTADTDIWATRVRVAQEPVAGGPYYDPSGHILDGSGITISVVDSGLFGAHPDFAGRILHNYVIAGDDAAANAPPVDVGATNSDISGGHGTHCNGIAAGGGQASDPNYPVANAAPAIGGVYTGVAPKAKLWAYGVGQAIAVLSADGAFMDILDQYDTKDPARIRVISNSYGNGAGSTYNPADTGACLVKALVAKGVALTYAAGNDGGDGSTDQTNSSCKDPTPGVICVASYDDAGTGNTNHPLSSFSSRSKVGNPTDYVDIAAPGDTITATCLQPVPGQAVCATGAETKWQPNYGTISGTSMATPHVAGMLALLFQAKPDLSPAQAEKLLQNTARRVGSDPYEDDPQNAGGKISFSYGAGLANLPAALDKLGIKKAGLPAPGVEFTVFDGDTDAAIVDEAADVTKLTMTETAGGVVPSGITFKLTVADAKGFTTASAITYTVHMNVAGNHFTSSVTSDGSKVTIPEAGEGNTAVASKVGINGNVISLFVPYSQMGFPAINEPIHNIRVSAIDDSGTLEDWAPSPMAGTNNYATVASAAANNAQDKFPVFGRAFTILQPAGLAPPSSEKSCVIPGLTEVTSPAGGTATGGSNLPTGQDDLRQAWIAEPESMPGKIVFTIKVDNLSTVPPGYRWYLYFNVPGDDKNYFVALNGVGATPSYIYGTRGSSADTTGDLPEVGGVGLFTVLGNLDAASNYKADGTITLVLSKATLNIKDGMQLKGIAASIRQTTNPTNGAGLTVDSAAAPGPYSVVGNTCKATSTAPTPSAPGTTIPTPTSVGSIGGGAGAVGASGAADGRFGGALGLLLLPLLASGALWRRRRSR